MLEKFADMAKGLKDKLDMEARLAAGKQFAASTYDAGKLEAARQQRQISAAQKASN
jgi:hypothetical protein